MRNNHLDRRWFLAGAAAVAGSRGFAAGRPPQILLRSSWQSVNIGDVGHTPGALDLIGRYFPEAEVTLWPGRLDNGSRELLAGHYPKLKIAEGSVDSANAPNTAALGKAWNGMSRKPRFAACLPTPYPANE